MEGNLLDARKDKNMKCKVIGVVVSAILFGLSTVSFCICKNAREIITIIPNSGIQYMLAWVLPFMSFGFGFFFLGLGLNTLIYNLTCYNPYAIIHEVVLGKLSKH